MSSPDDQRDEHVTSLVHDLAEQVPEVDPPLTAILAAARAEAGRRSRRRVVGVAAAVAAVVLGAVLVPVAFAHRDPRTADAPVVTPTLPVAPPDTPVEAPVAPPGMQLVGADGWAVAVPASWSNEQEPVCGYPSHPYYDLADGFDRRGLRCPAPYPRISKGAVSSLEISTAQLAQPAARAGVRRRPVRCGADGCDGVWRVLSTSHVGGYAPPRLVIFTVHLSEAPQQARRHLQELGRSLQPLPDGVTTVPGWPLATTAGGYGPVSRARYALLVRGAGLRPTTNVSPFNVDDGLGTSPVPGTVVPVGSTVTVGDHP